MNLTINEKESILNMQPEDEIIIDDPARSDCHYEIQRITNNEYYVYKMAVIICVGSTSLSSAKKVIDHIEGN